MELAVWSGLAAVPLVLGLVQVAKQVGFPSRWAGFLALILGTGGGLLWGSPDLGGLAEGIQVGLASAGLWSTGKAAISP